MTSVLRTDLLPKELLVVPDRFPISHQYTQLVQFATVLPRLRTPHPAKNLNEFYALVKNAIDDWERRSNLIEDAKVFYTEEDPDYEKDNKVIVSFSLVKRVPGAFSSGEAFHADVKNWRPVLREEVDDTENPGYKRAILGYWHDNEVKFTIWARTNKVANEKALWFENIMQEYSWYFLSQGVAKLLFMKRDADFITETNGAKLYARPIHYFVRTETISTISQKIIDQISVGSKVDEVSLLNVTR